MLSILFRVLSTSLFTVSIIVATTAVCRADDSSSSSKPINHCTGKCACIGGGTVTCDPDGESTCAGLACSCSQKYVDGLPDSCPCMSPL
jgi:hypothetical protein